MKMHPLINKDSKHYDTDKKIAIQELEKEISVIEMIGFCKANIFKYNFRQDDKGQKDSDLKKIGTYEKYLELLDNFYMHGHIINTVEDAMLDMKIAYKYR